MRHRRAHVRSERQVIRSRCQPERPVEVRPCAVVAPGVVRHPPGQLSDRASGGEQVPAAGARCGVHQRRTDLGVQVVQHLPVEHPAAYLRVRRLKRAHHCADARHPCRRSREIVIPRGLASLGPGRDRRCVALSAAHENGWGPRNRARRHPSHRVRRGSQRGSRGRDGAPRRVLIERCSCRPAHRNGRYCDRASHSRLRPARPGTGTHPAREARARTPERREGERCGPPGERDTRSGQL